MDYRRFFRQAMMLTITTGLLASCSKDNNVGEPEADALIEIIPGAAYTRVDNSSTSPNGTITGPVDNSMLKDLTFYFTRADEAGRNSWNYSEQAISGTCYDITENQAKVDLTPTQYYSIDGTETIMQGWYPQGTYSIDSRYNVPIVDFNFTGKEDIIVSQFIEGTIEDLAINGPEIFTFDHILTQLQFEATAESAIAAEQWGAIESITLIGETNNCTYYLIDNPEATWGRSTADFDVPMTSNITIEDEINTPVGIIMISPRTISSRDIITLSIKTTLKEDETEVIIDNELYEDVEFLAGHAYKVTLNFLQGEITIKLTPADWETAEGPENVDLAENQPYVISDMNYIVSRNMFGDAEGWIIRDEAWTTTPTAESETSIPVILEVATENITDNATLDHLGCPEGWRVPSKTELELIQRYKDKLTKTSSSGSYIPIEGSYWSGTQNAAGATYYIDMATGEFGTASEGDGKTHHIRCVRDVEM